jgi:hypothetical protein
MYSSYCTIQEAWPDYNYNHTINNIQKSQPIVEKMTQDIPENVPYQTDTSIASNHTIDLPELNDSMHDNYNKQNILLCNESAHHINNCQYCKKYYQFHNNLMKLFINTPQLKETITVFLIGLLIIIILNLYFKDT